MKKNPVLCFIFLFFMSVTPSYCLDLPNREVKAGVFNFNGYHSLNEKGGLEGYGIDLLTKLSEYSHLNFDLTGYEKSWQDMQDMLRNGEIDLVSSARRNPQREKDFAFSLPVGRNQTVLSKKLSNSKLYAGDYNSYDGMRIGIIEGSSQNKDLEAFAKDKGFEYIPVIFEDPQELTDALQQGIVDAILTSTLRKMDNETILDVIKSDNFYIITRKEDQDLIDEINYAIEQMNRNEGDWQNRLYFAHYGPQESEIHQFTDREKAFINFSTKRNQPIKALSRGDMPPYSYIEGGELKGIIPDYFVEIMEAAGLPYELVIPVDYDDYRKKSREVNVILDRIDPAIIEDDMIMRRFYTEPYIQAGLAKVERYDFNGPDKILALPEHPPFTLPDDIIKSRKIRYYPDSDQAIDAVQRGEADAAYVLPLAAQIYINKNPVKDLYYSMVDSSGASFRMHVPTAGNHELISIIRKTINNIPPGLFNLLSSRYTSISAGDMSLGQYLSAHPNLSFLGALAIALSASLMLIVFLHGRWSRHLLAATEKSNRALSGQLAIVEALSRHYANVLAINADDGATKIIKITDKRDITWPEESEVDYESIIGRYINGKVHPDDREELQKALSLKNVLAKLAKNEEYTGTYRIINNEKILFYQFTFVWPSEKSQNKENLILAGFKNIDAVLRKEQEQKKILEDALEKSRIASAAKTNFLNNMSHDIRTPMNAIIGFTSLASSHAENPAMVRRYLDKITTSGNHLLKLINDVLNMSRIESGKVKIKEEEVFLPQIMRDLQTIVHADIRTKELDFRMETENLTNETVFCDKLRLNQVLLNILSNAIKYTPSGGKIIIHIKQEKAEEPGSAGYEFRIIDNGLGMSPEFLKHVFDPFEREQTTTISGIEGTGLGLTITKKIIEMMEGTIDVSSTVGKGTQFIISFKFRIEEKEPSFSTSIKHVLLSHENESVCKHISDMLSRMGVKCDTTTLGEEVLNLARKAENYPYDLILVSWKHPDISGPKFLSDLSSIVQNRSPITVMCPPDGVNVEEIKNNYGISGFCQTPVFYSELIDILNLSERVDPGEDKTNSRESFRGKRILLVEDNEMNQEIAQMILEDAGFTIDIVSNGQEAVDKIKSMPAHTYALILMDVQMPVMNGYQATREIRNLPDREKSTISVIAMTANAFDEDKEEAKRSGMNGYVAKPIDIQNLLDTLEEVMKDGSRDLL